MKTLLVISKKVKFTASTLIIIIVEEVYAVHVTVLFRCKREDIEFIYHYDTLSKLGK